MTTKKTTKPETTATDRAIAAWQKRVKAAGEMLDGAMDSPVGGAFTGADVIALATLIYNAETGR